MRHGTISRMLATCVFAAGLALAASAVHAVANVTDTFELDGNLADDPNNTKDDWATVNPPSLGGAANIVRRAYIQDGTGPTIFAGGGSKDDLNLSGALSSAGGWKHKSGSVPPKDDITNAYAVAYNVSGDLVIYAGAERGATSGDAFMGFWFFKSTISLNDNGTFNGTHTVGDVLVLANYENGGSAVTIQVFEWNPAQATHNGTLKLLAGGLTQSAKCGTSISPLYCGITNATGEELPPASFLEVGINISQVLLQGGDTSAPCFSSFLAETRSSSSISATLKDFALGGFDVCGVTITKVCDTGTVNANGATIDYPFFGKISNVGFGALTNITLTDTPQATVPPAPAPIVGPFTYYACDANGKPTGPAISLGSLAAGANVCYASTLNTSNNGSTNSIKVVANTGPTTTTTGLLPAPAQCPPKVFNTGITATKDCKASLVGNGSYLFVSVEISGQVCNAGDVGLTGVTATDYIVGQFPSNVPLSTTALAPGACADYKTTYTPTAADAGTFTQFSDAVGAYGDPLPIANKPRITTQLNTAATCNLCPGTACLTSSGARLDTILQQQKTR